jgi:hypothetical protein
MLCTGLIWVGAGAMLATTRKLPAGCRLLDPFHRLLYVDGQAVFEDLALTGRLSAATDLQSMSLLGRPLAVEAPTGFSAMSCCFGVGLWFIHLCVEGALRADAVAVGAVRPRDGLAYFDHCALGTLGTEALGFVLGSPEV